MLMPRSVISMMFGSREIEQISVIASDPETFQRRDTGC